MQLYQFLRGNLEALAVHCPETHAWLAGRAPGLGLELNERGQLDWRLPDGSTLFAAAPPEVFYSDWSGRPGLEHGATLLVGVNLGYGLNALLAHTPESHKIMVLEPRAEMALAALGQTDYRPFITQGRLSFLPPDEGVLARRVQRLDLAFLFGKILVREDLPSRQLGPEYARWLAAAKVRMDSFSVELTTLRRMQDTMVGNELANFERAVNDGHVAPMQGAAQGLPAVIFGAGPSLVHTAPALASMDKSAIFACALQTLPAMHRLGLTPHFCMAIDFSEGMLHVFASLDREWASRIPLIYSTKVDSRVLDRYPGPTIPMWTMGGLSSFIMRDRGLVIDAGGNVGVTLFRFLAWCGARHIVLAGQDFGCLPGGSTHASGHHAGSQAVDHSPAFSVTLANAHGETIHSSPQFMAARRDLEEDIKRFSGRVDNLYGGGAPIAGARNVDAGMLTFEGSMIARPEELGRFRGALAASRTPLPRPVFEPRAHQWATSLRHAEKSLGKLFRKPERNQNQIRTLLSRVETFLKQDPLYYPYLFNEITDMAGLARACSRYAGPEFSRTRNVLRRVLDKVREVDRRLAAQPDSQAA